MLRNVSARPASAGDESFGDELVIGLHNDGARDGVFFGEFACRGQRIAWPQSALHDAVADPQIDLARERLCPFYKWYQHDGEKWTFQNTRCRETMNTC
jgi:hypothetical protein